MLCAPTVEDVLPTIRSRCRLVTLTTPTAERRRRVPGPQRRRRPTRSRRTPPAPARATSAGPGRWPATRRPATGAARWSSIPARLTSLGACMTAAANLTEVTKEEADLITGDLDAREKADLDDGVRRGRARPPAPRVRPRARRAGAGPEDPGQAPPPRRGRPRPDGPGLGLPRRDRARQRARRAPWSTRRSAATSSSSSRASTPELNLRRIGWIFEAREQMLEFNVPVPLALESMMVALQGARGRAPMRRVVAAAAWCSRSCVGVLAAVGLLLRDRGGSRRRPRLRPVAPSRRRGRRAGRRAARPGAGRVLRPAPRRGSRAATRRVRDARRCRSTTPSPTGATIDLALLSAGRDQDEQVGSLVVNPGGPGAPGTDYAAAARRRLRRAAARPLRHRRLRPARHRRQRPGRLPERRRARRLPRGRPRARHAAGERDVRRPRSSATRPGLRRATPASWRPTSPPSRPPATWTSCAPRSASRR